MTLKRLILEEIARLYLIQLHQTFLQSVDLLIVLAAANSLEGLSLPPRLWFLMPYQTFAKHNRFTPDTFLRPARAVSGPFAARIVPHGGVLRLKHLVAVLVFGQHAD